MKYHTRDERDILAIIALIIAVVLLAGVTLALLLVPTLRETVVTALFLLALLF